MYIIEFLQKFSRYKTSYSFTLMILQAIIIVGGAMMITTFMVDWLGMGSKAGFGAKQIMLFLTGFFLMLIGLPLRVKNMLIQDKVILSVILLLGLFLRIYDLGQESIWYDEGATIFAAKLSWHQFLEWQLGDTMPPLHYILLHGWIQLFGDSEFATRFLSVIFGMVAIIMIYKVGSLIYGKNAGILSALLLALSVFHIQYSQEVRSYALITPLTLLSMYFFIRLLKEKSLVVSIGYVLSSILLVYTHHFASFVIVAQNIYFTTLLFLPGDGNETNLKRWIFLQVLLIFLSLPLIPILLRQPSSLETINWWIPVPTWVSIIGTLQMYSTSPRLLWLFAILSTFSVLSYKKISGNIDWKKPFSSLYESYCWRVSLLNVATTYLLLLWLFVPIILLFIISRLYTPLYVNRYTIGASLAFYLLIAVVIEYISKHRIIKLTISLLIVYLLLVNIFGGYYNRVNKDQWREVVNNIEANAEPGDLVLINRDYLIKSTFDYYAKRTDLIKMSIGDIGSKPVDEDSVKKIVPMVKGFNRVWAVLHRSYDDQDLIADTLDESYNMLFYKKYVHDIRVYLWEHPVLY